MRAEERKIMTKSKQKTPKLTPYQRIVRAAKLQRGVRLTADECWLLGVMDDAIATRAMLDNEKHETTEPQKAGRMRPPR